MKGILKKAKIILAGLILSVIWVKFVEILLNYLAIEDVKYSIFGGVSIFGGKMYTSFFMLVVAPLGEEAAWRYAPITIARRAGEKYVFPVVVFSSWAFGFFLHPYNTAIIVQGVLGMIFSWVYIKTGYSYISSVITHSSYNFLTLLGFF